MIHFPFETNGKLMVLGVPILKHFRVFPTGVLRFKHLNIFNCQMNMQWVEAISSTNITYGPSLVLSGGEGFTLWHYPHMSNRPQRVVLSGAV